MVLLIKILLLLGLNGPLPLCCAYEFLLYWAGSAVHPAVGMKLKPNGVTCGDKS